MTITQSIANAIHNDPRGTPESGWLDTLEYLVARLADATSSHLQIGTYWCSDHDGDASASIIARVRARAALPGVESDYWEAAVCYTGSEEGAYADVNAFPFFEGSPVVSKGPISLDEELDEFRWYHFDNGQFIDRGWTYPDGPGEWGWVKKPGDEYWQSVSVTPTKARYEAGSAIEVVISDLVVPTAHRPRHESTARISLIHANRGRENTNLHPWGQRLPRKNSPHVIPISQLTIAGSETILDLTQFNIRGGWVPGKYHVALRVQNCHNPIDWAYSSDISKPFKFSVT